MYWDTFTSLIDEVSECEMLSKARMVHILHYLFESMKVEGEIAEFGCFTGRTAALLSHISNSQVWLYDSFDGLPDKTLGKDSTDIEWVDKTFVKGLFRSNQQDVLDLFNKYELKNPKIFKCWFNQITPDMLPDKFRFVHLDGDYYQSILDSLKVVYPRLSVGGVCVIDDYEYPHTPGVKTAMDEFMNDKPEKVYRLHQETREGSQSDCQAVFVKI